MKKTFDWFTSNGIAFTFHDYKKEGISTPKLKGWLKEHPLSVIVNNKGTTYRQLPDAAKAALAKITSALPVLTDQTSLMKRPIIEWNEQILVGFNPELWQTLK